MKKKQKGLTLVELMVTVAIFAIGISIAVPAFQNITRSNRITTQINLLSRDNNLARSEALKRGQLVVICSSSDGGASCTGEADWNVGWVVFSATGPLPGGAIDTTIRIQGPVQGGYTLTSAGFPNVSTITFRPNGYMRPAGGIGVATAGTFVLCDTTADGFEDTRGRGLAVSPLGRVSTLEDEDAVADRIVNFPAGANINCP